MVQFVDKYLDKYFARGHLGGFLESNYFSLTFPVHIFHSLNQSLTVWTSKLPVMSSSPSESRCKLKKKPNSRKPDNYKGTDPMYIYGHICQSEMMLAMLPRQGLSVNVILNSLVVAITVIYHLISVTFMDLFPLLWLCGSMTPAQAKHWLRERSPLVGGKKQKSQLKSRVEMLILG